MSGVTPLVDTLLATRLAQRTDLLPLKSELEIASPGAAIQVKKVTNDLRLPSRAALQQQLGVGLLKSGAGGQGHGPSRAEDAVTLSVAARAVNAILSRDAGTPPKIIGTEPLWQPSQPAQTPLLTDKLTSTVASSGLFYESHLAQYVAGTRTLAQLALEPQARLTAAPPAADVASADDGAGVAARAPAPAPALVAEAIHPETMALVRQQLELLSLPLFRWAGDAWPGARMDWEIQEEPDERQNADDREPVARHWTTRLAMRLPALGAVDARLILAGSTLQVHLAAREPATLALLAEGGHELHRRLGALGLQLTELRMDALAQAPLSAP